MAERDDLLDEQALLKQLGEPVNGTMPVDEPRQPQMRVADPVAPPDTGMAARKALGGYSNAGTMAGFNTALDYPDDKAATSVKNTFGRIASRYKNAPSSIDSILSDADFQKYFPNARKLEGGAGDKIDFGGVLSDFESGVPVGVVDVLQSADPNSDSAAAWGWIDEANDGGGGDPMAGMGGLQAMDPSAFGGGAEDSAAMRQIMDELEALQKGENTPMDFEALLAQLGGQ